MPTTGLSTVPGHPDEDQAWKVGAVTKSAGLTVRALHHYDHFGLLQPSSRITAEYRLGTADDLRRLYRISLLRRRGYSLEQIAHVLDDPDWQLVPAVQRHLTEIQRRA